VLTTFQRAPASYIPFTRTMATTSTGGAAASVSAAPAPALKALRRLDYTPVNYTTKTVNLDFNIKAGGTRVQATLGFEQLYTPAAGESAARSLVLHRGSTAVQTLVSVAVEGTELSPADYSLDEKTLTLTPPAGAAAFTVKIVTDVNPEANTSLEGLYKSGSAYSTQVRLVTAGACSRFRAALHAGTAESSHCFRAVKENAPGSISCTGSAATPDRRNLPPPPTLLFCSARRRASATFRCSRTAPT